MVHSYDKGCPVNFQKRMNYMDHPGVYQGTSYKFNYQSYWFTPSDQ